MKFNGKTLFVMGPLAGEGVALGVKVNALDENGNWADVTIMGDVPARLFDTYFDALQAVEITGAAKIGEYAFYGDAALALLALPAGLEEIGAHAFENCTALAGELAFPEGLKKIGTIAFKNTALEAVDVPASLETLCADILSGCTGLKKVVWRPVSVTIHGINNQTGAPFGGSGVTEFIFANDVEVIPTALCANLTALAAVTIPEGVKSIGFHAFYGDTALEELDIPASLETLHYDAVIGCTALKRVVWRPSSVTTPGINNHTDAPFRGGTGLTEFIIADGVTKIPTALCAALTALPAVTIPASVESIGAYAFYGDTALASVVIERTDALVTLANKNAFTSTAIASGTGYIYVPDTLDDGTDGVAAYTAATNWATYAAQIKPRSELGA